MTMHMEFIIFSVIIKGKNQKENQTPLPVPTHAPTFLTRRMQLSC
jgi:hypothetical protein